jgi:tetratricopeptide (TPR) repeat protein
VKRSNWVLAGLLAAFAVLGALRLNSFCLLEPDSPGYLIQAKSLSSFDGYREIDRPEQPLHTFRPPGLPVLLIPFAWIVPYSVVAAKLLILASALLAVVLVTRLAARDGPPWGAIVAALMFVTSPYALLHATEVVTEFPYLAVSLAAILLVTRQGAAPSRRDVAVLALLLSLLPFLRTIGIALVAAVAVWCVADRARRAWLPAPAIAAVVTAAWMLRNHLAGGPTYFGAITAAFARSGAAGFASRSFETAGFYASRFLDVLLPGVWPGRPLYERMTIGGTPDLAGLHGGGWVVALAVIGLAGWGLRARWRRDGALVAIYALLFVAVLAVYPPRHERLGWPLVPLVWALVPAGAAAAGRRLAPRRGLLRAAAGLAIAAAAGLSVWQSLASLATVRDNVAWSRGADSFYSDRIPPLYFADWQAAGRWLHENAPPGARVLTRHSDVFFTSGRPQDPIRFEELAPSVWRSRIASAGARYLAVPTSLYGKFFPLELLGSDPAYTYSIRWREGDVAVIEVAPNRSGRVAPPAPPSAETLAACEQAAAREPDRVDLATRCAELLSASGRTDDAIARLRTIVARGGADVRIQVALGQMLLDARRDAEAAEAFRTAAGLPEADLLQQTIERGRRMAEDLAAAKSIDKTVRARTLTVRARARMDTLRWGEAYALVQEALAFAPYDPVVAATGGDLAVRLGAYERALGFYEQAGHLGDASAAAKRDALREALATEASLDDADPRAIVAAAVYWAGDGAPGRALDILERAAARHPADAAIASRLAEVRRFFGVD